MIILEINRDIAWKDNDRSNRSIRNRITLHLWRYENYTETTSKQRNQIPQPSPLF